MKILLVRLGAIGDIVHSLPALAATRSAMPDARIGWAVESRNAEILSENPFIDELIELDTRSVRKLMAGSRAFVDLKGQANLLRKHKFDVAIDLQGLIKSAIVARLSGAKRRIGLDPDQMRERAGRVFLSETVATEPHENVIFQNLELVSKALGFAANKNELTFPIATTSEHKQEAEDAMKRLEGRPFAILNPGGGWVTKLWPAENFGRLADMLDAAGFTSILCTGPREDELAARALAASIGPNRPLHLKPSLKGFFELAKLASVYVGGDTGPTHLAVAAGAPIVGLFGPTEWWRNGSPRVEDICVERNDIGCRVDCHRRSCSNWICMDIAPSTVFEAVMKRISSTRLRGLTTASEAQAGS